MYFQADVDTAARERTVARHAIVDCYQRVLPKAQRKMAFGAEPTVRRSGSTRREGKIIKILQNIIELTKYFPVLGMSRNLTKL